jgi:hypothetical protein
MSYLRSAFSQARLLHAFSQIMSYCTLSDAVTDVVLVFPCDLHSHTLF